MPFLGTTPTQGFVGANPKQSFTANGSTTVFTLTNPVASANDLEVFVGNVRQEPTAAYSAAGTTLTMSEAPDTGLNFYVINKSQAQVTTNPPDGSVGTAKITDDAVTTAKVADDAVTNAKIGASAVNTTELGTGINLTGKVATGHETLSDHVATSLFSTVGYTSSGNWVTLGSIAIPKPGIWRVSTQMRIRWGNVAYFLKMMLTTSSQAGNSSTIANEIFAAGGGANSATRMLYERITVTTFGNLVIEPAWIVDVPTGLTSGDTIYFSIQPSGADTYALNNNDANGRPGAHAIKVAETTTSGSTITTRSF